MKQFLKMVAAVFVAMILRAHLVKGLKMLDRALEGVEDVPQMGATTAPSQTD